MFPILGEYSLNDIEIVVAFDISVRKAGKTINEAIYVSPNNFCRIANLKVLNKAPVLRGSTLDGNPEHLQKFVKESEEKAVDIPEVLKKYKVDVLLNLLPTGSMVHMICSAF
ncbi:MAG: Inositol-3-phosphate synthase [Parcubacteria group bacterium ADurb.Bin159]|nr:MAG: Inositol-3-phosphate synthase [Parcubacteria group bacterium ADurb.Bin159]